MNKMKMHDFMSDIWDDFGQVTIPEMNGSVLIFRDEKNVHGPPDHVYSYWIQFNDNDVLAVVPFDAEIEVHDQGIIIPGKYREESAINIELKFFYKALPMRF